MIHKNWAELIKPQQLDVKPGNDPARQATVMAEPLERGFGLTLGNALRRLGFNPELLVAHQGLSGQFQEYALEFWARHRPSCSCDVGCQRGSRTIETQKRRGKQAAPRKT